MYFYQVKTCFLTVLIILNLFINLKNAEQLPLHLLSFVVEYILRYDKQFLGIGEKFEQKKGKKPYKKAKIFQNKLN